MRGEGMHARNRHMDDDHADRRFNLFAPAISTLLDYLPMVSLTGGVTDEVVLQLLAYLDAMGVCECLRILQDECDCQSGLIMYKGVMIGALDKEKLTTIEEIETTFSGGDVRKKLISKVLIIMVTSADYKIAFPLAFKGTKGIDSDELMTICKDVIEKVKRLGKGKYHFDGAGGMSGDGLGANRNAMDKMIADGKSGTPQVDYPHVGKLEFSLVRRHDFRLLVSQEGSQLTFIAFRKLWNIMNYGNWDDDQATKNDDLVKKLMFEQLLTPTMLHPTDLMSVRTAKMISAEALETALKEGLPASDERDALCLWMRMKRNLYDLWHKNDFDTKAEYLRSGKISDACKEGYIAWLVQKKNDCKELYDYHIAWKSALKATGESCYSRETTEAILMNLEQYTVALTWIQQDIAKKGVTWIFDGRSMSTNPVENCISQIRRITDRGGATKSSFLAIATAWAKNQHEFMKKTCDITDFVLQTKTAREEYYDKQRQTNAGSAAACKACTLRPRRKRGRRTGPAPPRVGSAEHSNLLDYKRNLSLKALELGTTLTQCGSGIMNRQLAKGLIGGRDPIKKDNRVLARVITNDAGKLELKGFVWTIENYPYRKARASTGAGVRALR